MATGLLAIALGLLAGNLGSIFQMTQTVLGAISGPLIGIFISGICIPWANAKVRRCASLLVLLRSLKKYSEDFLLP